MRSLIRLACTLALLLPAALTAAERDFSDAELDRLLAPIALYPDTVLSHVLIAATYPLEIVEAARWSRRHAGLRGEEAVAAAAHEDWDPSVRALVAFPELLARMDEDLDWTRDLGDAFLAQEAAVADRVQTLRGRAYDAGHLDSLEHVRVIREPEVIYIEPAVTRVIHVPFYDTRIVYGSWWWPDYPPVYWAFPYRHHRAVWYWGAGYHVAPTFYFSSWHWSQRRVVVHRVHHHHHFRSGRDLAAHREARYWRHEASHRRGVAYRHERVRHEHASAASTGRQERRSTDRRGAHPTAYEDRRERSGWERRQAGPGSADAGRRGADRPARPAETRPASADRERRSELAAREPEPRSDRAGRPERSGRPPAGDRDSESQRRQPRSAGAAAGDSRREASEQRGRDRGQRGASAPPRNGSRTRAER